MHRHSFQFFEVIKNIISITIFSIICYFYLANFNYIFDIGLWDETNYLNWGLNIRNNGLPLASNGPLYSLWYYFLSNFESNPIELYFLNFKLMVFLPSLSLYLFMRLAKINNYISILTSTLMLVLLHNIWPFVSLFALIFLILGISLSFVIKNKPILFCIFSIVLLIISFIRPEFYISFIISFLTSSYFVFFKYKCKRRIKLFFSFFLFSGIITILHLLIGNPLNSPRSKLAFEQHYSLNIIEKNKIEIDPWTNSKIIIHKDFGEINSPKEALFKNPEKFFWHIKENLIKVPLIIGYKNIVLIFIILIFLYLARKHLPFVKKFTTSYLTKVLRDNLISLSMISISVIPSILSIIVIYPRGHYLIFALFLFIMAFAIFLFPKDNNDKTYLISHIIFLISLTLIITLGMKNLERIEKIEQKTLNYILAIKNFNSIDEFNLLHGTGGIEIYVPNYLPVHHYAKNQNFNAYLKQNDINMIVLDQQLLNHPKFKSDPEWIHFINNFNQFGFDKVYLKNVGTVLTKIQ